jgi:1-phosphofructokinase/tagatose 6-phosphate kinase
VIVCLAANPSVDKLFEVERLRPGTIHRPDGFVQVAGGKGLNVARAAYALGGEVRAVALLRGHTGKWLEEMLAAEGVRGSFVWTHGENRASLSVADRETGGLTEFYEHGSEVPEASWVETVHTVAELLPGASWLTISGSLPPGAPVEGYREVVAEARSAGVRVILDSEGERLRFALWGGPDVVKVNAHEAAELLDVSTETRAGAVTAARELRERAGGDGRAGIVTRGADGVVLCAPDGSCWEGRLYVRGRYPVGSGDSFLAGLVVALDRGDAGDDRWGEALQLALGAATANAELAGAGRLEPARAVALAAQAEVRPL